MSQHIPGSVLIIDDRFRNMISSDNDNDIDIERYGSELNQLRSLFLNFIKEGIPVLIFSSYNMDEFEDFVQKTQNIRVVILDLDLDGDGDVGDLDKLFVKEALVKMLGKYGYFFIIVYSAHSEVWQDEIWNDIKSDDSIPESIRKIPESMIIFYDKNSKNVLEEIINKIRDLPSLSIVLAFENELNRSLDKIAGRFVEFESGTWQFIINNIKKEVGDLWEYELVQTFLGLLKHYMKKKDIFPDPENFNRKSNHNEEMAKKIYRALNYIDNLPENVVYTGNLYRTSSDDPEKEYALIITPECDIAQNKHDNKFLVVYGINIENHFSKDYDREENNPPLYVKKAGKDINAPEKWRSFKNLNKIKNPNQYLYILPFVLSGSECVALDFRTVETLSEKDIKKNWTLIARINEPLITDIMDKFSNLFNRKGLPSLLPEDIKLIDEDHENS